jgi:hypothetical protein
MTKIRRTPLQTTERVQKNKGKEKQVALYTKKLNLLITGTNPEDHQKLAADLHKFIGSHPLIVGGKGKRHLHVVRGSSIPTKIFDGIV